MVEVYFDKTVKDYVDKDFYTGLSDREFINILGPQIGLIDYLNKKETVKDHLIKLFTDRFKYYPAKVEVSLRLSLDCRFIEVYLFFDAYNQYSTYIEARVPHRHYDYINITRVHHRHYGYKISTQTFKEAEPAFILNLFTNILYELI